MCCKTTDFQNIFTNVIREKKTGMRRFKGVPRPSDYKRESGVSLGGLYPYRARFRFVNRGQYTASGLGWGRFFLLSAFLGQQVNVLLRAPAGEPGELTDLTEIGNPMFAKEFSPIKVERVRECCPDTPRISIPFQ